MLRTVTSGPWEDSTILRLATLETIEANRFGGEVSCCEILRDLTSLMLEV